MCLTWGSAKETYTSFHIVAILIVNRQKRENSLTQGSHFFYPIKFPDFSLTFPWFPKSFPWFFLSFHQDILVKKKTYLFFLNVALVTLAYANIAISWQLLRFKS